MAQNALLNMLQAASNTAASNVSAPVDGLAWLLRKAGVPVPENALGGSNWMAQRGLTAPVQQGASQVAGDTLGLLAGPLAASGHAARGLLAVERNALAPRTITGPSAGQRGMIPVRFEKTDDWVAAGGRRLENGEVVVKKASPAFYQQEEKLNALYFAQDELSPKYEHFWRFTNNKDEVKLANAGKLRPSINHLDGTAERGLSVASGPHYGIHGYKHVYPVQGKVVGYGSDGEPLLDPKTVRAISGMQQPSVVMAADRKMAAKILRERGLPEDFMRDGVVFRNTPSDLFP